MKAIRNILYFIGALLLLQVIKALLGKSGIVSYYFWAMILSCLQYFLISGSILILLVAWLFRKKFNGKKKWMVSGGIVLVIFAGLEALFTFWLIHPTYIPEPMVSLYKFYYDSYDRRIIQFEQDHTGYDSSLFYKLKSNAAFRFKNREFDNAFITNSLGTRDDENSLLTPEVICLGDSYIMGWGVNQQESVPQQLEKLSGMKVLNAGISSYGTAREMILLGKINIASLKFLVIQYCENDTQENDTYRNNGYRLETSSKALFDTKQRMEEWSRKYFPGKHFFTIASLFIKHQLNRIYSFSTVDPESSIRDDKYQARLFLDVLTHSRLNLNNIHVIVTMMDSRQHLHNDFLNQVKLLSEQPPYKEKTGKLSTADISAILEESDFYKLDLHIKSSGHEKIAMHIFSIMQAKQNNLSLGGVN